MACVFAFDLDGTVHLGGELLPGAAELMAFLRASGVPHLFATNNSSASASHYLTLLNGMGIHAEARQVLTSNHVAAMHLHEQGVARAFIVGTPDVIAEYENGGLSHDTDTPQAVLLTYDTSLDYEKIRQVNSLLNAGLPYFATHPDVVCPARGGSLPDCGSFAALFLASSGRSPIVLGKPSRAMADAIRQRLEVNDGQNVVFVGDRLYTDVRMANEHGFTAVLTLTGEAAADDLSASAYTAEFVVDGLGDLLDMLRPIPIP